MKDKIIGLKKYLKEFGVKITVLHYLPWHFKLGTGISKWLFQCKHQAIDKYLYKNYKEIIDRYNGMSENDGTIAMDCPIWIMWWQGHENAPEIVKKCVESVTRNKGKHKVILLDSDNVMQYIHIPKHILEKYSEGKVGMAALSDVIRLTLLSEHGGIWCDATIFMTKEFNQHLYECKFYGIHMDLTKMLYTQCTEAKWSTFLIASGKNGKVVSFCREMMVSYWINHDLIIDYFLTDYVIKLAYNHIESINRIINEIPINNNYCAELLPVLGTPFDENKWNEMQDTSCYKLSWKEEDLEGIYSVNSFYNKILR